MRKLMIMGGLLIAVAAVGCQRNSSIDQIAGPSNVAPLLSGSVTPADPATPPAVTPALYGTISNLDLAAGTFTLISPAADTSEIATSPNTQVMFQGTMSDVSTSNLKDGETVTVTGALSGLPQQAMVRAQLIIINSSSINQNLQ